ncbi:MAG: DUF1552 domain-containing protein [Planctomycetales bacterium]|nr:DUF1552 domain-containing protein [Planctomycetales bacterium]
MGRNRNLSRRLMLQGTGVAIALPWLESLAVWGAPAPADAAEPAPSRDASESVDVPRRFAVLFMGNGINPDHWWAKQGNGSESASDELQLGQSLQPLEPIKHKVNVIHGLFNKQATGVGIHPGQTGNILSGAALQRGAVLRGGISVDQVLAKELGDATPQASIVLGCEQPITGYHETNFSMAYSSHISWQNTAAPVPMEVYPSLAFDSLFDNRGSQRMSSILDRAREHAEHIRRQVSHADRAKLDEYLTSVREVETRVQRMRDHQHKAEAKAADRNPLTLSRPDDGLPEDIREHMRLMCDLIAMAFQTDRTRVATLLLCRDLSGLFYPFLDVRLAHHPASHDERSDAYERISRYYCEQFAYLAKKLDAMPEADGTVLDHSCLLFLSNMWTGSQHDSTKVPVLQAGSLCNSIATGRSLDYLSAGDDNRKLCSLYLAILDRMNVKLDQFGDATTRLAGF